MRIVLILFAIMTLGVFGLIATLDTSTTGVVAGTFSLSPTCGDDGDEGDGDPPDNPDEDDTVENAALISDDDDEEDGFNGEPEDSEDGDPIDEYDDCFPFEPDPTLLGETATPDPTPCPTVPALPTFGSGGLDFPEECCPDFATDGGFYDVCCPDFNSQGFAIECCGQFVPTIAGDFPIECCIIFDPVNVGIEGPGVCFCDFSEGEVAAEGPGICVDGGSDIAPSDFDCDGSTTTADALGTLQVIAGAEPDEGDSEDPEDACGDSEDLPGDADCDDEIGTKDAIAILSVVAGFDDEEDCRD